MGRIQAAAELLEVELPKLTATTAVDDLAAWKAGPLRDAWRAAAKREHPDKAPADQRDAATRRFAALSDAHDRLQRLRVAAAQVVSDDEDDDEEESYDATPYDTRVTHHGTRTETAWRDAQGREHRRVVYNSRSRWWWRW